MPNPALALVRAIPVANPLLETFRTDILPGLEKGIYKRWGGVIRIAKGYEGAGQIVHHLRDGGQNLDTVQQLVKLNSSLGQALQLSQVAAAASVLNLGVSVAGFAYMAYQMKQMRKALANIEGLIQSGFANVDARLDEVVLRLEELRYFALMNLAASQDILHEIQTLRQEFFETEKARVLAALEVILAEPSDAASHLITFKEVRLSMEGILERAIDPSNPRRLVEISTRFRLWGLAVAAEAETLTAMGKHDETFACYHNAGRYALAQAATWIDAMLPDNTWQALGHTRFMPHVQEERLWRIGETALQEEFARSDYNDHKSKGALQHEHRIRHMDEEAFNYQIGAAALADMGIEVGRRLESKASEVELCLTKGWPIDEWRALGQEHSELVLLERPQSLR